MEQKDDSNVLTLAPITYVPRWNDDIQNVSDYDNPRLLILYSPKIYLKHHCHTHALFCHPFAQDIQVSQSIFLLTPLLSRCPVSSRCCKTPFLETFPSDIQYNFQILSASVAFVYIFPFNASTLFTYHVLVILRYVDDTVQTADTKRKLPVFLDSKEREKKGRIFCFKKTACSLAK